MGAGRPKGSGKVPATIAVRVGREDRDALQALAEREGLKLSEFIRQTLTRLVGGRRQQRPRRPKGRS